MQIYRIIIAGSRDINNYRIVEQVCDKIIAERKRSHKDHTFVIVSGHSKGADILGEEYARRHGLEVETFPADWATYGRSAGIIRNKEMAEIANEAIVFWNGESKGTSNMIEIAKAKKMQCTVVRF